MGHWVRLIVKTSRFRAPGHGEQQPARRVHWVRFSDTGWLPQYFSVSFCWESLDPHNTFGLHGISRNVDRPCSLVWGLEDPGWASPTTDFLCCLLMPQHHSKGQTEPADILSKPSACLGLFSFAPPETRERMSWLNLATFRYCGERLLRPILG